MPHGRNPFNNKCVAIIQPRSIPAAEAERRFRFDLTCIGAPILLVWLDT